MDPYDKISSSINKIQSDVKTDLLSAGYVVGIIIGIVGFIMLISQLLTIYKIRQIKKWPIKKKAGTIIDSYMENSSSNTTYSILIVSQGYYKLIYRTRASFTYNINGKTYISNSISYYEPWESNPIIAKTENLKLKQGQFVDIKVNPKNPSEAYIYNKPYDNYAKILFSAILVLIGLYIIFKTGFKN